jgi:Domain of unknown function (DUF4345)
MEFSFPWPTTDGEWLAWSSAAVTVLFGLIMLFLPNAGLKILRVQAAPDHPGTVAATRATIAGFHLGVGICSILLAQPLLYLALGFSWLFTAFGRLISILSDRGNTLYNWIWFLVELALAGLPLAFALGFVS